MGEGLIPGAEMTQKTAASPKPTTAVVTAYKAWTGGAKFNLLSEILSHSL